MESSQTLTRLADILEVRQQAASRPYNLLLTSTLSLTPTILQNICHSDNWSVFRQFMYDLGLRDRFHALRPLLQTSPHSDGYRALARLITRRYFSTILTTNIDSALENALDDVLIEGGQRPRSFQTLVLDRDTDEHVVQALDDRTDGICIVKLHGSLQDSVIPASFPDFFELCDDVLESVKRYLNQDLIIVGSIEHEDDMNRALTRYGGSSVYSVLPEMLTPDDNIVKLMKARGKDPEKYMITEQYGDFDLFFTTLEALLLNKTATSPEQRKRLSLHEEQPSTRDHVISNTTPAQSREAARVGAPRADILVVTVTEVEANSVFDIVRERLGIEYERCPIGDKTYYNLGVINGARVFLVQSEMGISGPGGSQLTVFQAIQVLAPSAVVMVGIAFGFDPKRQRIGDILVSQQLHGYELQRVGRLRTVPRGDRVTASVRLLDRFKSGHKDWQGQHVKFGLILSGEKLVDNKEFRDQLYKLEPEAIGGEMEGMGLYAAAHRSKVDWLLVKAICDFADGNKSQNKSLHQEEAARNAALFTIHVLQTTDFVDSSSSGTPL